MSDKKDTREIVLETAELLAQRRGLHAFSYKDIGDLVGIKTASIHYYFPHKSDMALAIVDRYVNRVKSMLVETEENLTTAPERLRAFGQFFLSIPRGDDRFCLIAMLGAEVLTMPDAVRDNLKGAFEYIEQWLERVIQAGMDASELSPVENPREAAVLLLATLEGGMLISRTRDDPEYYEKLIAGALARTGVPGP